MIQVESDANEMYKKSQDVVAMEYRELLDDLTGETEELPYPMEI